MEQLFPLGIQHYILGGLLVGVGIAVPFMLTGLVAARRVMGCVVMLH